MRKWSVLCSNCGAIYQATSGMVIGAWLRFTHGHRDVYQARIQMKTGSTKTVEMEQLIDANILVVVVTPLNGLGKLKPISLIEIQTQHSHLLIHPQQQILKYQSYGAIGIIILVVCLGLSFKGTMDAIFVVAIVCSLAAVAIMSRVYRGRESNPQIRNRLLLEQRLIKQSDHWGEQLQQLEKELSKLHQINQRLLPYDENTLFQISSLSKKPRERQYFENRYHSLSELIECYILAKNLIDTSLPIIQLTEEVPFDLVDQVSDFIQDIQHLESRYRANS